MKSEGAIITLIMFIVISAAFAMYYTFTSEKCDTFACFQENMVTCSRATYVNEEPEASWGYEIIKRERIGCNIEVTLLSAKEGDLKLRRFERHTMTCTYPHGTVAYPDKDMSFCHGLLKEDIQGLIIDKLHTYVVDNLEGIKNSLQ